MNVGKKQYTEEKLPHDEFINFRTIVKTVSKFTFTTIKR